MKITVAELKRIVYEAVAQAKTAIKASENEFKGEPPKKKRGPDGHEELTQHNLSVPPEGGGRLKRQGRHNSPIAFTSEEIIREIVDEVVKKVIRK